VTSKIGCSINLNPKGTSLFENKLYDVYRQNQSTGARSARAEVSIMPADDRLSLKGAWSLSRYLFNFC